ncbi:MAG: hypothetical protein K8S27_09030 [Candidatus Omnitrophica bacterium]|nr:hypothetical protein [Candidatus Omnitrophota bacterium]
MSKNLFTKDFCLFFFFLFLALFNWPILTIFDKGNSNTTFWFLFLTWAAGILCLFLLSRSFRKTTQSNKDRNQK